MTFWFYHFNSGTAAKVSGKREKERKIRKYKKNDSFCSGEFRKKMSPVPISQKFRLVGLEVEKVASA